MKKVIDFYCYDGTDEYGRTHQHMIAMSDDRMEADHDYIQWLFPLHEASNFNPDAPIVDRESVKILRANNSAGLRMLNSFERFLNFLGFEYVHGVDGGIVEDPEKEINRKNWQQFGNHNHLRITRAIRSLRLFGFEDDAKDLYDAVIESATKANCIGPSAAKYWKLALDDDPFETLRK